VSWASGGWLHPSRRGTSYDGIVAAWDWYPLRAILVTTIRALVWSAEIDLRVETSDR
jgi:hypothetical protein